MKEEIAFCQNHKNHPSDIVKLLFRFYEKNFKKILQMALDLKYDFCPLSFKTKFRFLGQKLSEI